MLLSTTPQIVYIGSPGDYLLLLFLLAVFLHSLSPPWAA